MGIRCGDTYQIQNYTEISNSTVAGSTQASGNIWGSQISSAEQPVPELSFSQPQEYNFDQEAIVNAVINNLQLPTSARTALAPKCRAIVLYSQNNNIKLEEEELIARLENYARGLQLNNKLNTAYENGLALYDSIADMHNIPEEQLSEYHEAIKNVMLNNPSEIVVDYQSPEGVTDDEKLEALRAHYQDLATNYIANFDRNNNGQIEIFEVYERELGDYYQAQGMDARTAYMRTCQAIDRLDLEDLTRRISVGGKLTDEESMFLIVAERFDVLNKDYDGELDLTNDEVQRYFAAASQYSGDQTPSLTDTEYFVFENDIYDNPEKVKSWLNGAGSFLGLE